jgi:hypothetical protein
MISIPGIVRVKSRIRLIIGMGGIFPFIDITGILPDVVAIYSSACCITYKANTEEAHQAHN